MCRTIVAHHYACGHSRRQYFPNDPICLPGPELCQRVGTLRYHHFYWNQTSDWPSAMHEANHRYGACDLCAAHCFYRSHDGGGYHPWTVFLRTDTHAHQSGFAVHEECARAAEEEEWANNPTGGWCPELLPVVTERLERMLWDLPEGVTLKDLYLPSSMDDDVSDAADEINTADDDNKSSSSSSSSGSEAWRDDTMRHMVLHGNPGGASMLMHILRHIHTLPLGGPNEWSGLVHRVALACGQWRYFAAKPEVFDGVERVAQEMGHGLLFGNVERAAYRELASILDEHYSARKISDRVLAWVQEETSFSFLDAVVE
ncbi:hypothetical protein PG989_012140 [Apiospora arundinis]